MTVWWWCSNLLSALLTALIAIIAGAYLVLGRDPLLQIDTLVIATGSVAIQTLVGVLPAVAQLLVARQQLPSRAPRRPDPLCDVDPDRRGHRPHAHIPPELVLIPAHAALEPARDQTARRR